MAYGTINADQIGTSVANTSLGAGNASIMKNRIINGAMVISQRGTSFTNQTAGVYYLDRWQSFQNFGTVTVQQSTTAPTGFNNSLSVTVTTPNASPGSTAIYALDQSVEGFNVGDCGFGTANAKTMTVSFWVQASVTGTYCVFFRNANQDRYYTAEYTITAANTWQQKSITFTGDTSGTWNTGNGVGIDVGFSLGLGSGRTGTAGAWTSSAIYGTSNQTNLIGTNGATFYITGVQLEVGSSATGYEYRQYGQELALCQRYYWAAASGVNSAIAMGGYVNSTQIRTTVKFPVSMRTTPALAATSGTDYYGMYVNGANDYFNSFTIYFPNTESAAIYNASESSGTAGQAGFVYTNTASASLAFSAEL